jgi:hypothetical protein
MIHIYPGEVMMETLRQEHQRRVQKAIEDAQFLQEVRRQRHRQEAGQPMLVTLIRKLLVPYRVHAAQ